MGKNEDIEITIKKAFWDEVCRTAYAAGVEPAAWLRSCYYADRVRFEDRSAARRAANIIAAREAENPKNPGCRKCKHVIALAGVERDMKCEAPGNFKIDELWDGDHSAIIEHPSVLNADRRCKWFKSDGDANA